PTRWAEGSNRSGAIRERRKLGSSPRRYHSRTRSRHQRADDLALDGLGERAREGTPTLAAYRRALHSHASPWQAGVSAPAGAPPVRGKGASHPADRSAIHRLLPAVDQRTARAYGRKVTMSDRIGAGFEALRKQAKRWLASLRAEDREALARLERVLPQHSARLGLREVQQALAREQGFASWAQLKEHHQLLAL